MCRENILTCHAKNSQKDGWLNLMLVLLRSNNIETRLLALIEYIIHSYNICQRNKWINCAFLFRYANFYYVNNTQHRDLIKAYGIRFILSVQSKAGKFDIIPLTMNVGSGLALLGISTLICDFLVLYCLKGRQKYSSAKYHRITGEDAYQVRFNKYLVFFICVSGIHF